MEYEFLGCDGVPIHKGDHIKSTEIKEDAWELIELKSNATLVKNLKYGTVGNGQGVLPGEKHKYWYKIPE